MAFPALGRLETLTAKSVWQYEAQTFTPWLAENLDLLATELDLGELELKDTEVPAGDFRIDILAEDDGGNLVLIENQFGPTDHKHLGQLITYAASQNRGVTSIWIAETIREDHRAAIDWLNRTTSEDFDFFGVEVAAVKIGDSDPAPIFRVVAKPNNWSREVGETIRAGELSGRQQLHFEFWSTFADFLKQRDPSFRIGKVNKDHWRNFRIGRSGYVISVTISTQKRRVGVELYIHRDPQKRAFKQLLAQKAEIEATIGEELEWMELPNKQASRIALFWRDIDPSERSNFPAIQEWMLKRMQLFREAFTGRVKALDLESEEGVPEDDE